MIYSGVQILSLFFFPQAALSADCLTLAIDPVTRVITYATCRPQDELRAVWKRSDGKTIQHNIPEARRKRDSFRLREPPDTSGTLTFERLARGKVVEQKSIAVAAAKNSLPPLPPEPAQGEPPCIELSIPELVSEPPPSEASRLAYLGFQQARMNYRTCRPEDPLEVLVVNEGDGQTNRFSELRKSKGTNFFKLLLANDTDYRIRLRRQKSDGSWEGVERSISVPTFADVYGKKGRDLASLETEITALAAAAESRHKLIVSPFFGFSKVALHNQLIGPLTLLSKVGGGFKIAYERNWNPELSTILSLDYRRFEFQKLVNRTFQEGPYDQIGMNVTAIHPFAAGLRGRSGISFAQEHYARAPTSTEILLDKVVVPKLSLGFDYSLLSIDGGSFGPFAEAWLKLPRQTGPFRTQTNGDWQTGLFYRNATDRFQGSVAYGKFDYDTSALRQQEDFLYLALSWAFPVGKK